MNVCDGFSLHSTTNKQPTDCVTFLNTFSLKGFLPEVEHSNLLLAGGEGGGISYSHCRGACETQWRGGLFKLEGFFGLDNV